jgi:signal transduction histidine kinase
VEEEWTGEIAIPREDAVVERLRERLGLAAGDSLRTVPIVVDPSLHGMLAAVRHAPGTLDDRAAELLQALADAAAIALVNAHLYERMRAARLEAERRNEALVRLQEASVGLLNLGEAPSHDRLIEILCHVTGAPRGVYWLRDEEAAGPSALTARGTYGVRRTPRNATDQRMQDLLLRVEMSSDHPVARASRTMCPVSLGDTLEDLSWTEFSSLWSRTGIRSILAMPLRARGRLLGVVALFWREPGRSADEAVIKTAEVMANQVAAALDTGALVEELSRASRLKDEFLATLSHELRNPLNVISGFAQLLARDPEAQRLPVVRRAAEAIRRNAAVQAQLVADLLDLSRLQTGKLGLDRQTVSLDTLVAEAAEALRDEAETRRILMRIERCGEPVLAEADPVRVQQIVWNLVQNAVKFTPDGGRVTVRLERDGAEARLVVEDTGQGLDPLFLPDVFEMFSQADTRVSRRYGGLGIGLSLVRQLAELHGGRVRAESEGQGRGARFIVWLPVLPPGLELATASAGVESGSLAHVRMLVVDDSADTTTMLRQLLQFQGAEVSTAANGDEALRLVEGRDFDVVVSDLAMPGMDGYELLRELRTRPRTAGVPAIAVTGLGQSEDAERSRAAGFFAHLAKPVQITRLVEATLAALGQPIEM